MSLMSKSIRGILGVAALIMALALVSNWWGDYRSSKEPEGTSGQESVAPTGTADAPAADETTAPVETVPEEPAQQPDQGLATEPAESKTVVVAVDGLNFRVSPSRDSVLIRGLDADTRLTWLATEQGWYKVRDEDGVVGYVSSSEQYTRLEE